VSPIGRSDPGCRGVRTSSNPGADPRGSAGHAAKSTDSLPHQVDHQRGTISPPTRENTPHLRAGSRYGPTPATPDGKADRPLPATATRAQEHRWPPTPEPGDRPHARLPTSPTAPLDLAGSSTSALATLPEVLTAREAAAILRVGRNQLYQAVTRGELAAVRIGRSIRIPKQALLDLLAAASPGRAGGDE
jgi:excisionase family DNA binding protein